LPQRTRLLRAAPALRVLATSRAPLNLFGECHYRVESLAEAAAAELFVDRARSVEGLAEEAAAIGEICRRLDCLPLALELAAARTTMLSPSKLAERLQRRLPLLERGPRDLPERQQTLRAAIDWSYALLDPEQQRLVMLETICEFARELLDASADGDSFARRHAEWFVAFAERNEADWRAGEVPLEALEAELANFRAALRSPSRCSRLISTSDSSVSNDASRTCSAASTVEPPTKTERPAKTCVGRSREPTRKRRSAWPERCSCYGTTTWPRARAGSNRRSASGAPLRSTRSPAR
jgi:hypothetical protein